MLQEAEVFFPYIRNLVGFNYADKTEITTTITQVAFPPIIIDQNIYTWQ